MTRIRFGASLQTTTPYDDRLVCAIVGPPAQETTVALASRIAAALRLRLALVDIRAPLAPMASPAAAGMPPVLAPAPALPAELADSENVTPPTDLIGLASRVGVDPAEVESLVGDPADKLAELSASPATAMLVVADSGRGAAWAWFTQEPGRAALADISCPILLVPTSVRAPWKIVAGVRDDEVAPRVTAFAAKLAQALDAPIELLHATSEPPFEPAKYPFLQDCARLVPRDLAVRLTVGPEPATALVAGVIENDPGAIVVLGQPDRGTLASAIWGSVVHGILSARSAPVVVIPRGTARASA